MTDNEKIEKFALPIGVSICVFFVVIPYINLFFPTSIGFMAYLVKWPILYPFTIFVTFVHECGHAVASLLTGGHVESMAVAKDGSGLTISRNVPGIRTLVVMNAGYMASTLYGAIMMIWAARTRNYSAVLKFSAICIIASTVFFTIFSSDWFTSQGIKVSMKLFSIVAGLVISIALLLISKLKSKYLQAIFVYFLASQSMLNALSDIKTVFFASMQGVVCDATNLAAVTGVPGAFWAISWGFISVVLISYAFKLSLSTNKYL